MINPPFDEPSHYPECSTELGVYQACLRAHVRRGPGGWIDTGEAIVDHARQRVRRVQWGCHGSLVREACQQNA